MRLSKHSRILVSPYLRIIPLVVAIYTIKRKHRRDSTTPGPNNVRRGKHQSRRTVRPLPSSLPTDIDADAASDAALSTRAVGPCTPLLRTVCAAC